MLFEKHFSLENNTKKAEQESEIETEKEKEATNNLKDLGLNWDLLKDKIILDIGAGPALIAEVAKKKGIKIISLDKNPEMWIEDGIKIPDVPYIKGEAENLPFPDETFDLIICRAGPLLIANNKEEIKQRLKEAERVLKKGGEIRFGPNSLNANIFEEEELFTPEESQSFTREERIKRIAEKSLEFLKTINPNIERQSIENSSPNDPPETFYVLKKIIQE